MSPFAQNLKKARQHKGWTQAKAAAKIGIPRHNIGAYEEGRATPPLDVFVKIARAFDIADVSFADSPDFKLTR